MTPLLTPALAQGITDRDWHLLAMDGRPVAEGVTLSFGADGSLHGKAPCNSFGSRNGASLPALALAPIRATRMACPRLEEEQAFFDLLPQMTAALSDRPDRLVLTSPDGRSLEFVADLAGATCITCPPGE
jgi:heat shock protein HslJ